MTTLIEAAEVPDAAEISAAPVRVFKFWAEPASAEDAAVITDQIRLATDYRWQLARIENRRRALERARDEAGLLPLLTVARDPATTAAARKLINVEVKRLRTERNTPAWRAEGTQISDAAHAAVRWARSTSSACGLYWGTYLLIEEAHDMACRTTPIWDDIQPPRRAGEGAIGVQIQSTSPMSCEQLHDGEDTRARLGRDLYGLGSRVAGYRGRAPAGHLNRGGNDPARKLCALQIRTGSTPSRGPMWTRLHVLQHRALPAGQVIGVRVHQSRTGLRLRWNVQVVIKLAGASARPDVGLAPARAVGVDLGWRRLSDGGIRVAFAVGTDGAHHELVIEPGVLRRATKSSDLLSIRDQHRNRIRTMLVELRGAAPAWFLDETTHMHLWRRTARFVVLHRRWGEARWAGDEGAYLIVRQWLDQDRHLLDWQEHNLRRMRHQVRGRFALFATRLAKTYGTICLEEMDLSDLRARGRAAPSTGAPTVGKIADDRAAVVAPGEFRSMLVAQAAACRRTVIKLDPSNTTRACAACGTVASEPVGVALLVTCAACGVRADQDLRAAENLLADGLAQLAGGEAFATKKKPSRAAGRLRGNRKRLVADPRATAT